MLWSNSLWPPILKGDKMSWFSRFLDPSAGYRAGQQELDKYYNQAQNYYNQGQSQMQPYANYGHEAYGNLQAAMQALLNPQGLHDKWVSGYHESEAAKNAEALAKQHGLDAASSMGLLGSSPALNAIQSGTTQIAMNDRDNYLNQMMQKYLAGLGVGGNIFNVGANTAAGMGQNAMNMGQNAMNMGQNSAQMQYNNANAPGNLFGQILGMGGSLAGSYLTGGMNQVGRAIAQPQGQRDGITPPAWRLS